MARKTNDKQKLTYTVAESTKITGIGVNQTYELLRKRVMPHIRVGSRYVIPKQALVRWLENCGRSE